MDLIEEQKVDTPRVRINDIIVDTDIDEDLSIYPRPRSSAASRLTPTKLCKSRGVTFLKWIFCLIVVVLLIHLMPRDRRTQNMKHKNEAAILLWNEEIPLSGWNQYQCPCVLTDIQKNSTLPIDAVIVNADRPYTLLGLEKIKLTPNFLLIFATKTSMNLVQNPLMQHTEFYFNFTMTYRLDSDLLWSEYYFSTLHSIHQPVKEFDVSQKNLSNYLSSTLRYRLKLKHILAVYMNYEFNDYTKSQSYYLQELRKYMNLAVIETCHEVEECLPYKFMLIFDSSSCPDFLHSQIYMALANFVVPVVISSGDISQLVPLGSYINAADFPSPEELAQYLIVFVSKPHIYERYFWWHSRYQLHQNKQPYCDVCRELKKPRRERKPEEFEKWWSQYKCQPAPTTLYMPLVEKD